MVTLTFLSLVACESPPTPDEVRASISDDLGHILRETAAATETLDELPGSASFDLLDRAFGAQTGAISPRLASGVRAFGRIGAIVAPHRARTGRLPLDPVDDPAAETVRLLNEKIFVDANHQGDGIFALPIDLLCERTEFDDNGNESTVIDAKCATDLAQVDPRIRVSRDDGALRFGMQVGADHDEPVSFTLSHDRLAITVDLDESADALAALAPVFGEDLPNVRMSGAITGAIDITGPARAVLGLAIDRAVSLAFADEGVALDGPGAFRVSSAKAKVLGVTLDGAVKSAAFVLALGETAVHAPGDAEPIDLDLPGITAEATFGGAGTALEVRNISLGARTTTLSVGGARALAIDLNPDDGRAVTATITADAATGTETLAVSPKLDVRYAVDHAVLGDEAPVYDVTQVLLDGSLRTASGEDRIQVMTGSLRLTTNPANFGFSAAAGQCVLPTEAEEAGSNRSFTVWTVGTCE